MTNTEPPKIPVTLLSGFLGSGKTTLVNRILRESQSQRIAVLVNEFGELGIDGRLVMGVDDDIVELANGCICCSILDDLRGALHKVLRRQRRRLFRKDPVDRILIESSGMASPGPAVQTLFLDSDLASATDLDAVVTLAHAAHIHRQIQEHPEASTQIAYADRVLVNHCDQAEPEVVDQAEVSIRALNSMAPIRRSQFAETPIDFVLAARARDPEAWHLDEGANDSGHSHSHRVQSISLVSEEPIDLHTLKMWLQFIAKSQTHEIMRMKGVLECEQSEGAVVVQAIYQWLELGPHEGDAPDRSVLVIIGRDLDPDALQRGWDRCRKAPSAQD